MVIRHANNLEVANLTVMVAVIIAFVLDILKVASAKLNVPR